jgi:hypothetical protein
MSRPGRVMAASTIAMLVTALVVCSRRARAGSGDLVVSVPAYWSPSSTPEGVADFRRLADAAGAVDIVVMNGPASAAPVPFDEETANTIRMLRRAGITVLGYVDSGYLGRTGMTTTRVSPGSADVADWVSQVRADVADWYDLYGWYGLGGVFIDQTLSSCGENEAYLGAYRDALDGAQQGNRGSMMVAMNPGTDTDECYTEIADVIVTFENTYEAYRSWTPPAWTRRYPVEQFWHLVYDAPTTEAMNATVDWAGQRQAGMIYVTDLPMTEARSQWDALPAYWGEELCRVAAEGASCG